MISTSYLTGLLAERYAPPAFAFLREVADATGNRHTGWADGIAMSLWPSRGLSLHGFEVKVSRSDWLRELKNPEKADKFVGYCDHWWIVAGDPEIVKLGELPATWGLIVLRGEKTLRVEKEAPKLKAKTLDRWLMAAILRRTTEQLVPDVKLKQEFQRGQDAERAAIIADRADEVEEAKKELGKMRQLVTLFEHHSGIPLSGWHAMSEERVRRVAEIAKAIVDDEEDDHWNTLERRLERILETGKDLVQETEKRLILFRGLVEGEKSVRAKTPPAPGNLV